MNVSQRTDVVLRAAGPADRAAIAALDGLSRTTRRLLAIDLADPDRRVARVAQDQGHVVGFAMATRQPDEVHLLDLAVAPSHRSRGVARRLVAELATSAQHDGAHAMTLEVRSSNGAARRLYEALGCSTAGVRRGYYRDGEDAVIMWHRDLASLRRAAVGATTSTAGTG